jgi:sugar phosphate isomerase/epimerase
VTIRLDRLCGIADEGAFALGDQLALHTEMGLRGIELRATSGRLLHELSESAFGSLQAAISARGLVVPVVCTPIGNWARSLAHPVDDDLDLLRIYARRARALGCTRLRIMSYPNDGRADAAWRDEVFNRLTTLAAAASRDGVMLLHENCSGWASQHADATVEMLEYVGDERLRLVFDVGNDAARSADGHAFLKRVLPWVEHVHVKDVVLDGCATRFVLPGDGDARVVDALALLNGSSFAGWISAEPHLANVPHTNQTAGDSILATTYRAAVGRLRELLADTCDAPAR